MYKEILHECKILGFDIVIKETQYPDITYFNTSFELGNNRHIMRHYALDSMKGAVRIIIANYINQRSW